MDVDEILVKFDVGGMTYYNASNMKSISGRSRLAPSVFNML